MKPLLHLEYRSKPPHLSRTCTLTTCTYIIKHIRTHTHMHACITWLSQAIDIQEQLFDDLDNFRVFQESAQNAGVDWTHFQSAVNAGTGQIHSNGTGTRARRALHTDPGFAPGRTATTKSPPPSSSSSSSSSSATSVPSPVHRGGGGGGGGGGVSAVGSGVIERVNRYRTRPMFKKVDK